MSASYFFEQTMDDLMHEVIVELLASGRRVTSGKGENIELTGVMLELENPRARLSRSEKRGKPFSCLGELLWYLSRTNDLSFIQYYIPAYRYSADGDKVWGGYGPRLFDWNGINQFKNIVDRLSRNPSSRKAVIQLFDGQDLVEPHNDIPCTCTLQFFVRDELLHMLTTMRSNDIYKGFPHDVFCFTMLQEILARTLGLEMGNYKHCAGSLHLYTADEEKAAEFLGEGWQSTLYPMPPMPGGDPWPSINLLMEAEAAIRLKGVDAVDFSSGIDAYWADLFRLLQIFRCCAKDKDAKAAIEIQGKMYTPTYGAFIAKKIADIH